MLTRVLFLAAVAGLLAVPLGAQPPATPAGAPVTVCGTQVNPPVNLPPANSGPVLWQIAPCFEAQGGVSLIDINTYIYYIQLKDVVSKASENLWRPYNDATEKIILDDFKRLWPTNFLDNLWIDVRDYPFSTGLVCKIVTHSV